MTIFTIFKGQISSICWTQTAHELEIVSSYNVIFNLYDLSI